MTRILVAEDSLTQATHIRLLLQQAKFDVELARDGVQALESIKDHQPDIVLTDLDMPEMDGLQLVQAVRSNFPKVPVILMTAMGSEETAMSALKKGAASYVPKRVLERDIVNTIRDVLSMARTAQDQLRLRECLVEVDSVFRLGNDSSLVQPLVSHLQDELARIKLCDETGLMQLTIAMTEAADNGIHHGNLELDSKLREGDGQAYIRLAEQRRGELPYRDRSVTVRTKVSEDEFRFEVRDEGPGFDPSVIPDPTDATNIEKLSGRGLLLIQTFMDQVLHNESGNQITMIKRREPSPA